MDDLELNDFATRQLARFPNFHHSSPLTYYPQRHVVELYSGRSNIKVIPLFSKLLAIVNHFNLSRSSELRLTEDPTCLYSYILHACTSNTSIGVTGAPTEFILALRVAINEVRADLSALRFHHPFLSETHFDLVLDDEHIALFQSELSMLLNLRKYLVEIRSKVQQLHVSGDDSLSSPMTFRDLTISAVKEILFVEQAGQPNQLLLINYDQLLMLTDTVSCRFMTRLVCMINDINSQDSLPSWELVRRIYKWGDGMIEECGMNAYVVIGEFESIVTSMFVNFESSDPLGLGDDFSASISETAAEIQENYGVPTVYVQSLTSILREVSSVNSLSEIFGIRKHWGNPMVDASSSGLAVQEKIAEEIPIEGTALISLVSSFNRMITLEFIRQHGEWPKCEFRDIGDNYPLKVAFERGVTRIPETAPGHQHSHWALQRFFSNCTLEEFENQISLLSDKSVSLYRSNLDWIYVQSLCGTRQSQRPDESRRLILEFLRRQQIPILDIFKIVMSGAVPDEWLSNSAAMKGTEMKHEKARIFAVLTYELRQFFAATEELIKDNIFKYNPHQTMTMNESELLSKLRTITRQMDPDSNSRFLCVMHIIDFSKWNLRMKYENTCLVFKSIDDFMGTPGLIESTHNLFSGMINVVQDAFNPPPQGVEGTSSNTVWSFHTAGWEGQRQKGWTVLTSALLSNIERVTGIHSVICGQGDNQTLLSYFPVPETYRNPSEWIDHAPVETKMVLDDFYSKLERECLAVGLKVKTAESCRSLCYFNYGKRLYFSGVELSMTLKRISKAITEPNGTYPITELLLKTEEGASFSAGLYSHPSILPYLASKVSVAMTLLDSFKRNPLVAQFGTETLSRQGLSLNLRFLSTLMKVPASLGGVPQLSLASYLFRGHPDPLCTDLVMLKLRANSGCRVSKAIIMLAKGGKFFNSIIGDRETLIASPYSLNLNIPTSATEPLMREVRPAVSAQCRNPDIKGLFSTETDQDDRNILEALSSLEPFQPLVANDIYSRTLPGRRKGFLSSLTNTTSLGRLVYESAFNPVVLQVKRLESLQIEHWIWLAITIGNHNFNLDPAVIVESHDQLAQSLRDQSWGCTITGVTVPHPLEQFVLMKAENDMCSHHESVSCCPEHILLVRHSENLIAPPSIDSLDFKMTRSRSSSPYLGSTISEGVIQKYLSCSNPTSAFIDAVRLNIVRRWVSTSGNNLDNLLKAIIRSRTDVDLNTLGLISGRPSRLSYSHRAALIPTIKTCAVSTTSNMYSRIYLSSNRMGEYSHGEFNYHLPYGSVFLCMQSLICLEGFFSGGQDWALPGRVVYHAHLRSPNVPIVFDGTLDIIGGGVNRELGIRAPIPIMFTAAAKLRLNLQGSTTDASIWSSFEHARTRQARIGYSHQLLGNSFAYEITIREQVTNELMESYAHRENPISIGDISLVGVRQFIEALAVNMLLMAPYAVMNHQNMNPVVFSVYCRQYIDTYSNSFWKQFEPPFCSFRNLQQLILLSGTFSSYSMTRVSSGTISLIKELVVQTMYNLKTNLQDYFRGHRNSFPFDIYAPSVYAARLLWSKTCELCVMALLFSGADTFEEFTAYARDFSANIHSHRLEHFGIIMLDVITDFERLKERLGIRNTVGLPRIKIYSLVLPWVDKARGELSTLLPVRPISVVARPNLFLHDESMVSFLFGPAEILVEATTCQCPSPNRSPSIHIECFFTPTGLLSKSHYKFLDITLSLGLEFGDTICLGTSTGTEALALASFPACEKVYVNCYFDISSFSPHLAGTYMPAAFIGRPESSKIVNASSSVTSSCDLLLDSTVLSILDHTRSFHSPIVTCDAEMPSADFNDCLRLLRNVIRICVERPTECKWLIIKLPAKCKHELRSVVGLAAATFTSVRVILSPYTKQRMKNYFIVCETIHQIPTNRHMSNLYIPLSLTSEQRLENLIRISESRQLPGICYLPTFARLQRLALHGLLQNSFAVACSIYVSGFGTCVTTLPTRGQLARSCEALIETLQRSAIESVRIANRTFRQVTMVRSNILQLATDPLHCLINDIFTKCNRLELLRQFLDNDHVNLSTFEAKCRNWLQRDHFYEFGNRQFRLEIDATKFISFHSRYLLEILGTMFKWEFQTTITTHVTPVYHCFSLEGPRLRSQFYLTSLPIRNILPSVSTKWSWYRRAEVIFSLTVPILLDTDNCAVSVPHPYVIVDTLRDRNLLPTMKVVHQSELSSDNIVDAIWYGDGPLRVSVLEDLSTKFIIVLSARDLPLLSSHCEIVGLYKLPWTGLVPSLVMASCDTAGTIVRRRIFPDFSLINQSSFELGLELVGCGCYDCAFEVWITRRYGISSSSIDRTISRRRIESVLDRRHLI